jgi:hypothetical protein
MGAIAILSVSLAALLALRPHRVIDDSGVRLAGLWIDDASEVLSGGRNPGKWGLHGLTVADLYLFLSRGNSGFARDVLYRNWADHLLCRAGNGTALDSAPGRFPEARFAIRVLQKVVRVVVKWY